jgi:oligopeptide/dipeptide ABC transporter ATP-binding protein
MNELLKIENLKTYFYTSSGVVKAVDDVSFSVPKKGRLGIVGESGCGKSITSLSILRLVSSPGKIIGGKILFNPPNPPFSKGDEGGFIDLLAASENTMRKIRGGKIAMIFQEPMTSLNPVFTVGNQIEEAVELHQDLSKAERWETVIESLRLVGIPDPERIAKSYPHELSGGMRQRVMIAMALSCRPALLIADEPTTALDVTIQAQVLALLKDVQEKLGMAFILITHDLGVIAETVDEVAVMYAGKIVERASTEALFEHPRHPYTRALLHSLPSLETHGRLQTIPGSVPDLSKLPRGCVYQDRCEKAQAKCREEEPVLTELSPEHYGRCYFPY